MSKQDFLNGLYSFLNGQIPANQVEENIRYYRDYIDSQIRSGKSEEEVLRALGDPRLIARTIVEISGPAAANEADEYYRDNGYESSDTSAKDSFESRQKTFRMPGWLMAILLFLVLLFLLSLVISVLSFLAPLIIVMAMVIFLVKLFRDWLN